MHDPGGIANDEVFEKFPNRFMKSLAVDPLGPQRGQAICVGARPESVYTSRSAGDSIDAPLLSPPGCVSGT